MKGDIGMAWSTKNEQGHKTTWNHPYIFVPFIHRQGIRKKDIGMVSCSFVYICCVMTLVSSFLVLQAIPISPSFWRNPFSTLYIEAYVRAVMVSLERLILILNGEAGIGTIIQNTTIQKILQFKKLAKVHQVGWSSSQELQSMAEMVAATYST